MKTENSGLQVPAVGSAATVYVWVIVTLASIGVVAIAYLAVTQPANLSMRLTIMGSIFILIGMFLGLALQQVHLAVNSRLSELITLTAASSEAEGKRKAEHRE